jgi:hypothetical protein
MSISKIKEKSLTTGAVTDANFDKTVLTDQTELSASAASDDILLIYDTSAGVIKKIQKSNVSLQVPTFSSVSPTSLTTGDLTGNYTIVVTGTSFDENATFKLRTTGGTDISMDSVTRNSSTQLTGTVAKNTANLTNANEPFDIVITNGSGLSTVTTDQINVDAQPVYTTASGSLGSGNGNASLSFSVNATDPESAGNVTFELQSGSLPPGLSLTNTAAEGGTAIISGTATNPAANTTYNFTLRAFDAASNVSSRAFSITINRTVTSESFTSSGTFSVPSGLTSVDVLVVAGGGAGGSWGGGGGAGGLIFMPEYPVTPGGTVTVTVGCGGSGHPYPSGVFTSGQTGQDSVFGTLTAKGGGGGGGHSSNTQGARTGGSGGGAGRDTNVCGAGATQPTQPGNSGAYGFGFPGGASPAPTASGSGGGGGAGAAGTLGQAPDGQPSYSCRSQGGAGKAYTIADGTTPVYYAGGGGGGVQRAPNSTVTAGGQGGGGRGGAEVDTPGVAFPGTTFGKGADGTANRGGGGGGSGIASSPCSGASGSGGKGIVIVRY